MGDARLTLGYLPVSVTCARGLARCLVHVRALALVIVVASTVYGQNPGNDDTFSDRLVINRVLQEQLERGRSNQPVAWQNPKTGHDGRVVVFPATSRGDTHCRPYEFTWNMGTQSTRYRGMPCRDSRGMWVGADEIAVDFFEVPRLSGPASFDCRSASQMHERLICSDARVAASDAEMGRRYARLRSVASPPDSASIADDQAEWIRQRNQRCDITDRSTIAGRDHWRQLVNCLNAETAARGQVLQARQVEIEERQQQLQDAIARVRRNLARLAYVDGTETGGLDPRLAAAIREFERDEGLPVTGAPSELVVARSQAVIGRLTRSAGCLMGKGTVHTQRICGRVKPN